MPTEINPASFPQPQSNYSQGVVHDAGAQRRVISGQVGVKSDGSVAKGLDAQMRQTWENFLAVLDSAGFTKADVVKVTIFATVPALQEFRRGREEALSGIHRLQPMCRSQGWLILNSLLRLRARPSRVEPLEMMRWCAVGRIISSIRIRTG